MGYKDAMRHEERPLVMSNVAVWALIIGASSLLVAFGGPLLLSALGRPPSPATALLALVLAVAAILAGHSGVSHASKDKGRRGKTLAVLGMLLGYALIPLFLMGQIGGPQFVHIQNVVNEDSQMLGIAAALGQCEQTLAESLINGEEFTCEKAGVHLETFEDLTVTIESLGSRTCLITAIATGS
ncbi:MAG: hypothetical protein D6E12_16000, partial [Desulfovibrio sp.]